MNPTDLPPVLVADDVARLLRVNRKTVYDAAARGDLPCRRIGRALRFDRDTVLRWLSCQPPAESERR